MADNKAPSVVPTPAGGPPLSAVEQASAAAREAIAKGQDPTAGKPDLGNVEDGSGRPVALPKRDPNGTGKFAADGKREIGEGAPDPRNRSLEGDVGGHDSEDDDEELAPGDGSEDEGEDLGADEGEEGDGEIEAQDGADEEGGEGEGDEGDENIVILPGRRPGQEFQLQVDDPETAERLRQLTNGYMAGEAVRAAHADIEQKYQQLELAQDTIAEDPAGFWLSNLPQRSDLQAHAALSLLVQPEVWKLVAPRLTKMVSDPSALEAETTKVKVERYEMRDTLRDAAAERREVQRNLQQIQGTLGQLMPTDFSERQQSAFWRDSMTELQRYAEVHDLNTIPVADMPVILARVMQQHGINPVEAAARIGKGGTRSRAPQPGERSTPKNGAPKKNGQRPSGKQFVEGQQRRAAAARVAPAGAGAPTTAAALTPPKKADGSAMSVAETTAWHRAQLQKGRNLMTPGQRT